MLVGLIHPTRLEYHTNKWIQCGPTDWLWQVVLLHMETSFPDFTIRELPAKNQGGPYHELLETKEAITACDVALMAEPRALYIPCHTKCVSIAKRVFSACHISIEDGMKHLWRVLEARFEKAKAETIFPIFNIHSGLGHSNIGRFQELVWEPGTEPEEKFQSDVGISCSLFQVVLIAGSISKQIPKTFPG